MSTPAVNLATARLILRPVTANDAARFTAIQADWNVARMLRLAPWPPDSVATAAWLETADADWIAGRAYRFAMIHDDRVIGCADVDGVEGGWGSFGYWLEAAAWGRGFASEAAARMRDFAFETVGLQGLHSGHAGDNPASGRVLMRLGFSRVGETLRWSRPRNAKIAYIAYRLARPAQP